MLAGGELSDTHNLMPLHIPTLINLPLKTISPSCFTEPLAPVMSVETTLVTVVTRNLRITWDLPIP